MHTSQTWCMDSQLLYLTNHSHNQLQYLNQISGGKTSTESWPVIGRPLSMQLKQHLKYRTRILLILHLKCWHCTENSWPMHNKTQPTNHHPHHWDAMSKIPTILWNTSHASNPMQQNSLRKCMASKEPTSIQDGRQSLHTNQQNKQ